jgi:hopanoid biosynthesis associated RND transporter like protein HpnN
MSDLTPDRDHGSPPSGRGTALVRLVLVRLVDAVCSRPRLVLALALVSCVASLVAAALRLEYHTGRNDLVSSSKDYQQRWQRYLGEFGDDDDIVVVVKGADRPRMQAALDRIAARLAEQPESFDRIFHKVDLGHLKGRALLLAPREQIRTIHDDHLADMKRLLDSGAIGWHALGLHSMLQEARQRIARLSATPSTKDERFLTQLAAVVRTARACVEDSAAYKSPWSGMPGADPSQEDMLAKPHYFFSGDGALGFLLARPVKEAGSFTAALRSVRAARVIAAEVNAEFADLEVGLTGLPVLETDEMVAAETDTRLASWLAIIGVSLLFLVVYRSIYYPILTVVTLLVGTAWAFGWLTLTVGHLNILSTTFAVMLIGMGDYGVLWVMRYEHARRQGFGVRSALLHTTTHVAIGNLTAASTLALAFFAALFADFKAVGELGWIAGCGVLLCAFACFTVLPACLMVFDRRGVLVRAGVLSILPREDAWLPWLRRRAGLVLAASVALVVVVGAFATRIGYNHNLLELQAENLDSVRWERTLLDHTTGASWHALTYRKSREEAIALRDRFRAMPEVSQVIEVASLVPPDQADKLPLVAGIHSQLSRLPRRGRPIPHIAPDVDALREDLAGVLALCSRKEQPLLADLGAGLIDLERSLGRSDDGAAARLKRFDESLAEDLAENLHRLHEVSTPKLIELDDLPPGLRERYVGASGTWLLRVFAKGDLWEFGPLETFTRQILDVDAEATGKPFSTVEGLKAMKNGLFRAGVYAFLVIVLVLWLDFRSPGRTLLGVLPLLLGVVLTLGWLGLLGLPLNPANMIAFPLILGVGVDNGVHVLHDYLIRRRTGRPGISRAIGRGVLVKALTTMIGFGTLMISTERGLVGLGFILTLGVGCSMVAALVILPAVLELIDRRERLAMREAVPAAQAA